jgi:hypothetical protein
MRLVRHSVCEPRLSGARRSVPGYQLIGQDEGTLARSACSDKLSTLSMIKIG